MTSFRALIAALVSIAMVVSSCKDEGGGGPKKLRATKTEQHVNIPGTRVFILPPEGAKRSTSLPALEIGDNGLIQAMDLVGGNFFINAANVTRESYERNRIEVFEFKEYEVSGYPAKMVFMQADPETKVINVTFGDSSFSVSLMAVFPTNDEELGEKIKHSLSTLYYDTTHVVDLFSAVSYKLNDSQSIFKFARAVTSSFIYSIGGVKKDSYKGEPFMTVVSAPLEGETLQQMGDGMAGMMENGSEKNRDTSLTNGFRSLKRELHGTMNGEPIHLYQHIVVIDGDAVIIQGIAERDFGEYLPEFQKLSNTITKKVAYDLIRCRSRSWLFRRRGVRSGVNTIVDRVLMLQPCNCLQNRW